MRQIGERGLALIKRWEGCKLKAYKCPAGVLTVGYGSTGQHVKPGMAITQAQADKLLRHDLARFESAVDQLAPGASQNEFDAMVSLAFNIGVARFKESTVLRRHKAGQRQSAAAAFLMWNRAGGQILKGLTNRRTDEAALYLSRP